MSDTTETVAGVAATAVEPGDKAPTEKTYTQSDFDRIMQGRLAKFADYDDLKTELDALKASTASDQEKAIETAKAEGRGEVRDSLLQRLIESESRAIAAEAGFFDPKDAHLFIDRASVVTKDGEIDGDALASAISKIAEDKPHLIKSPNTSPSAKDVGIGVSGGATDPGPGVARLEAAFASKK